MSKKELKPIKEYNLTSKKQARYVPIMDRDPVLAARALTKKDVEKAYKLLTETFEGIRAHKNYYEPMANTLLYSGENFAWFSSMFKELENILDIRDKFEIPFEEAPIFVQLKAPVAYQPFHPEIVKGSILLCNYRTLSKQLSFINNYRIKYLMENYDMSEFIDDAYPAWYLLKKTTVFEQYSEKTSVRVRIDFYNGEFYYFIAGASDNWKEIKNVPIEMDDVIAALIFRSYDDV